MTRRALNFLAMALFHAACALSLLACVAMVVLWVRSYRAGDDIGYSSGPHRYYLRTGGGEIAFEVYDYTGQHFPPQFRWDVHPARAGQLYFIHRDSVWKRMGFYKDAATFGGTTQTLGTLRTVMAPMWAAALATAALPLAWLARAAWRRLRPRLGPGFCPGCGYDLRATPGRCPECGTPADGGGGGKAPAGETPAVT